MENVDELSRFGLEQITLFQHGNWIVYGQDHEEAVGCFLQEKMAA